MLDAIKKMVGKQEPQAEMLALQTEFSSYKETAEALMAEMQAQLDARTQALAELEAKIAEYAAQAEAEKAAAQAAAEEAATKKLQARKETIKEAIGDLKAEEVFQATAGLDDEAFEKVAKAFALAVDVEASSPAFQEQGVNAEVDAASLVQESAVMKAIREKYQSK